MKILIVDDDEALRKSIALGLRRQQYDVAEAQDGESALEMTRSLTPDLVLSDIGMTGMDGYGLLQTLRSAPATSAIPVILMTGLSATNGARHGMELGADDYLTKPIDMSALLAAVESRLKRKQTIEQQVRSNDEETLEVEMLHSEEKYRTLVETTGTGFAIVSAQGVVLDANDEFVRLTGRKQAGDVIGHSLLEWTVEQERERNTSEILKCLARGFVKNLELNYVDRSGRITPVEINATVTETEHGQRILALCRDITLRKTREQALRNSEDQFRATFNLASVGMAQADPVTGRWLRINEKMCAITGYSAEELLKIRVPEITHPDDRDRDWEAFQRVVKGESPDYRMEKRYIRKDGTIAWVNVNMTILRDAAGRPARTMATIEDITERKRAESELAQRHQLAALGAEVAMALTLQERLDTILYECAACLVQRLGVAFARIWTVNRAEQVLELRASAGMYTHLNGSHSRVPIGKFKIGLIADECRAHLTNSVIGDPRVSDQEWAKKEGMVAFAGYPLVVGGQVVGVMAMFSRKELTDAIFHELPAIADSIALGIVRKQSEDALRLQTSALEAAANGIVITDLDGRIAWVNPAFTQLTGYGEREAIGKGSSLFKSGRHDSEFYKKLWVTILEGHVWHGELVNRRKDGTLYDEEMTITPVRDNKGDIRNFVAIKRDITQRKWAEETLRSREESFRALTDHSPDGVARFDRNLRFVYANPAVQKTVGVPLEQLMGRTGKELNLPSYSKWDAAIERVIETGQDQQFEFEFPNNTGTQYFESRLVPERNAEGKVEFVLAVTRNVTEQRRAGLEHELLEVQLRQAQKLEAIGRLAAGIAHEINTPTQYVGDNTRFLKDAFQILSDALGKCSEVVTAAKQNAVTPELLQRAEESLAKNDLDYFFQQVPAAIGETLEGVERVTKIVRAMKEFSHPGQKEKMGADLNKAIESTVTVARNEWKYVADMTLQLAPDLPLVPCFLGEFNQVILNLVVNASHAIADVVKQNPGTKGTITIRTSFNGEHAEVRVSDTGTGISEANHSRIFEPFFTTKDVGKGTGQGLALVYGSIVTKHGGSVDFETEVGKGTTFIIRLPVGQTKRSDAM
jgi:two-component system NtrC family sensor kinase